MAGNQNGKNGKCPEGFVPVFGPLCVEYDTLSKVKEAIPELPKFDFTDPGCEAALAAFKSVMKSLEQAIEMPKKLMSVAKGLIEKPFNAAQQLVNSTLGIFDEIGQALDDLLKPGMLAELARALRKMLNCPFMADLPIARTAAGILDSIENGTDITGMLGTFKEQLKKAASDQIKAAEEMPLSSLANLEKLYNDSLERMGIQDLVDKANDLYKCVEAACDLIKVAERIPHTPSSILESINAKIDETTGRITGAVVKTANNTQQAALNAARSLGVIRFSGGG